jgi:Transposase domain (DUF772)
VEKPANLRSGIPRVERISFVCPRCLEGVDDEAEEAGAIRVRGLVPCPVGEHIDLKHPLVRLAQETDWRFFEAAIDPLYSEHGRPAGPVRFRVGLHILKHTFNLSDEECDRWVENPYFQYFTGEEYFPHALATTGMMRWRRGVSEQELARLLQDSLRIAHKKGVDRLYANERLLTADDWKAADTL